MKRHFLLTGGLLAGLIATTLPAQSSPSHFADLARIRGADRASVWLVIVGDFAIEESRTFQRDSWPVIDSLYVRPGKLRVAWINLPNQASKSSRIAAEVAACAGSGSKFWPVHDAILLEQPRWIGLADPTRFLVDLADLHGGNAQVIDDCLQKHQLTAFLKSDITRAERAGIRRAPGYLVGNRVVVGGQALVLLRHAIDEALAGR